MSIEDFAYGKALDSEAVIEHAMLNETTTDEAAEMSYSHSERTADLETDIHHLPIFGHEVEGNIMPTAARDYSFSTEHRTPVSISADDGRSCQVYQVDHDGYGSRDPEYKGYEKDYTCMNAASREEDVFAGFWRPHKLY